MELTTTVEIKTQVPDTTTENHSSTKVPSFLTSTNGVLKRHAPPLHLHQQGHGHPVVITYKECLKNHAASMGGHAVDGCGEFMPSPTSDPSDPTSLRCAACGCHRNFHRRDPDVVPATPPILPTLEYQPYNRHLPLPPPPQRVVSPINDNNNNNSPSQSPPPISSAYPHTLLSLGGGGGGGAHQHQHQHQAAGNYHVSASGAGHVASAGMMGSNSTTTRIKRSRTRFTQYQKEKMLELAERIGWKMQKRDEDVIMKFCNEIGVERVVFKVWMHNNKNTTASGSCNKRLDHQHHVAANLSSSTPQMLIANPGNLVNMGGGDNNNNSNKEKNNNGIVNGYDQEMREIHHHDHNLSQLQNSQTHETATSDDSTGTSDGTVGINGGSNNSSSSS